MDRRRSTGVMVEAYPKLLKAPLHHLMVMIHYLLRRLSFFRCLDRNRYAMLIGATDVGDIPSLGAQVANINIRRNIAACQVTNVKWSICIGQC